MTWPYWWENEYVHVQKDVHVDNRYLQDNEHKRMGQYNMWADEHTAYKRANRHAVYGKDSPKIHINIFMSPPDINTFMST